MAVEIQKANAFSIEPGKSYIVTFESEVDLHTDEVEHIKKSITKIFEVNGAKVKPIIAVKGHINITEVKE